MKRLPQNQFVTPEVILAGYHQGLFPMADERGRIGFYAYEPRGIVPLDDRFRVRKSLRQILNRNDYRIAFDTAPRAVLEACSREGLAPLYERWLSSELVELYLEIFEMGALHTVEVWKERVVDGVRQEVLVGGLYGVAFGGAFCGESMFSHEPYGSQIALVYLVQRLRERGFTLLDAQMASDHLRQFGLYPCTQDEYRVMFREAAQIPVTF